MRAFIGSKLLTTLKPRDKQYDIRDSKLAGFLIRVNPSGKMTYVCQYARGRRVNIGTVGVIAPMQARDKALAILNDAANGIFPNDPSKLGAKISLKIFLRDHYSI